MNKLRLFRVGREFQPTGPNVGYTMVRAIPITMLLVVSALLCVWRSRSADENGFSHTTSNFGPVVFDLNADSLQDVLMGRKLDAEDEGYQVNPCDGTCTTKDTDLMTNQLNSDFLMIDGSGMLKYDDPGDCDMIILPDDDVYSDDAECIFELGEGRRRHERVKATEYARSERRRNTPHVDYDKNPYEFQDDVFTRDPDTLKCEKSKSKGDVTVTGSDENQISPGALPILQTEKIVWIAFYVIFGIVYMFIALAIVCDEFFVPALECFVDAFGISMDVAGATFMAAGGSMPELFTSFIATFKESEVGFVAIVGSAVFNVLFVIAVCAIASTEVLTLTWWPLFRDCCFYIIALVTVAFVFQISSKNEIEWWEAIILLMEYIGYCSFMKVNGKVYSIVERMLSRGEKTKKIAPEDEIRAEAAEEDGKERRNSKGDANFGKPSAFRQGIMKLMTQNAFLYETAGMAAVAEIKGELEETFKKLDVDGNGYLTVNEMKELLEKMGVKSDTTAIKTAMRRINRTNDDQITFEAFSKWYIASEARIEAEMSRVFSKFDADGNGTIEADELKDCLKSLGHKPTQQEIEELMIELTSAPKQNGDSVQVQDIGGSPSPPITDETPDQTDVRHVTFEQFEAWYKKSMFYEGKKREVEEQAEDEDEGMNLDMPDTAGWVGIAWWAFTYPLCAVMYSTLPDVRAPKYQRNWKMAIVEFGISLLWIGIFSNWLYECIVVVSNTLGIPVAVSAVTLLAGGTSVPDLISSYVVARNGEGDMAVSSSIGSNIFDVTVGLPLPWLTYCITKGKSFALGASGSKGIGFSILLLVGMLAAVVGTVMAMKWRMTKCLGYCMLIFYVLYVLQYLLQKLPTDCDINKVGVFQVDF